MAGEFGKRPSFVEDMARGDTRPFVGYLGPTEAGVHDVDQPTRERTVVSSENLQKMQKFLATKALDQDAATSPVSGRSPQDRFPPVSDQSFDEAWKEREDA